MLRKQKALLTGVTHYDDLCKKESILIVPIAHQPDSDFCDWEHKRVHTFTPMRNGNFCCSHCKDGLIDGGFSRYEQPYQIGNLYWLQKSAHAPRAEATDFVKVKSIQMKKFESLTPVEVNLAGADTLKELRERYKALRSNKWYRDVNPYVWVIQLCSVSETEFECYERNKKSA